MSSTKQEVSLTISDVTSRRPTSLHGQNSHLACQQCCRSDHSLDDCKTTLMINAVVFLGNMESARTSS